MFKVKDNKIVFGNIEILIPEEFRNKKIIKIFGTSTCGLFKSIGYISSKKDVILVREFGTDKVFECVLLGEGEITETVFIREQLDIETGKQFFIASKFEIDPQLNWITTELDDGKRIRYCPLTMRFTCL